MLVADQNFNSVLRASVHNAQALFRDLHSATEADGVALVLKVLQTRFVTITVRCDAAAAKNRANDAGGEEAEPAPAEPTLLPQNIVRENTTSVATTATPVPFRLAQMLL